MLHRTLPEILFSGNQEGVEVEVRRLSALQLARWDDQCLAIDAQVGVQIKLPERSVPGLLSRIPGVRSDEFELKLRVQLLIDVETLPNWTIQTKTTANYSWIQKPTFGISIFDVDVSRIAERAIDRHLADACTLVDTFLQQELGLQQIVQAAWEVLQPVLPIEDSLPAHLLLRPDGQLGGHQIVVAPDALTLELVVQGQVSVRIGRVPELPPLAMLLPLRQTVAGGPIRWQVVAGLAQLAAIAHEQGHPAYARLLENERLMRMLQWPILSPIRRRIAAQLPMLIPIVEHWLNETLQRLAIPPYLTLTVVLQQISLQPFHLQGDTVYLNGTAEARAEIQIALEAVGN